jgi:hypothetical protein
MSRWHLRHVWTKKPGRRFIGSIGGLAALLSIALATAAPAGAEQVRVRAATAIPVVVIVMENEQYQRIVGSANAPFINNTLIPGGMLDTNYVAVLGSLPDYLVMVSGQGAPPPSAANLFTALGTATSWREFMESMPSACYPSATYGVVYGTGWGLYTRYHNPAVQFTAVNKTSLCNKVVPLNLAYFNPAALPAFSFVVPNECNDMHTLPANGQCPTWNGSTNTAANAITMGDNWLASFVPAVAKVATVIVTWDEGSPSNEQVVTVAYGAGVVPGRDNAAYTHSSLEAGLYAYYGLGTAPGSGATATALPIP